MKNGFTLGEVLMAILVIGIVAAMTMPRIINNFQKDTFATHLKRLALDIENAAYLHTMHCAKSSFANTEAFSDSHDCANCDVFMTTYLKAKKSDKTFAKSYISIDESSITDNFKCTGKSYKLPDSTSLCVTEKTTALGDFSPFFELIVDLNGKIGPNVSGRDFFKLYLDQSGKVTGIEPGLTVEDITFAIYTVLNSGCIQGYNVDVNGDGSCDIADVTLLINLRLNAKPDPSICTQNSDGINCFAILKQNGWKMDY